MLKKTLKEHGLPLASASAVAIFAFGVPADAQAGFGDIIASEILTTINLPGSNGTQYDYEVVNLSHAYGGGFADINLVDWEIPYNPDGFFQVETDADGLIISNNVLSPDNTDWVAYVDQIGVSNPSHAWGGVADWLDTSDLWNQFLVDAADGLFPLILPADIAEELLAATHVIHWAIPPDFFSTEFQCDGHPVLGNDIDPDCFWGWGDVEEGGEVPPDAIGYGESLGGFGIVDINSFEAVAGPYQASWVEQPPQAGDPPRPGGPPSTSPSTSTALAAQPNAAPEPGSLALLATGLIGGALVARSRRRRKLQS